ncbi:helix-turn-helix domain-containing protein [Streptomyces sp. NPDC001404]|uniref:helix-turn-helix domain-containing protein n=1 Tax=Streptomyces sp. NPDC001404 TaxID=3364571 RepID=UPI0036962719
MRGPGRRMRKSRAVAGGVRAGRAPGPGGRGPRDRVEVAALFKVSVKAVDNWWAKRQAGGRDALLSRTRGRRVGEHQVLSEGEQAAVRQAALDHIPPTWGFRVSCGRGGR